MVGLNSYMWLSLAVFTIGMMGFLTRRSIIVVFMSIELMLNAANLAFVSFASHMGSLDGQIFVFFVMTVAAAEAAVGLAIMLALFRHNQSLDLQDINLLHG